jgi:hypothetical protein
MMFGKRVVLAAAVGLAVFAGGFGSSAGSVHAQDRLAAIARPDLGLTARDLPPGYEEATPIGLRLGETELDDHMLQRTTAGTGPVFIWTATFKPTTPVTDERLDRWSRDMATVFGRYFRDVTMTDWETLDPAGIGEQATMYSFRFQLVESEGSGDGALVVFSRGDTVSLIATLSGDGRSTVDLRQYAQMVDGRMQHEVQQAAR